MRLEKQKKNKKSPVTSSLDKQFSINIHHLLGVSGYPAVSVWERVILEDQYPTQWTQYLDTAVGTYNRSML